MHFTCCTHTTSRDSPSALPGTAASRTVVWRSVLPTFNTQTCTSASFSLTVTFIDSIWTTTTAGVVVYMLYSVHVNHVSLMLVSQKSHVSHMSVTCQSHVSLTCQSHVSHTSVSHVSHMSVTCQSHVSHMQHAICGISHCHHP